MNRHHADVIIVGAGPTGLLLAGDLAAAGASVTILEKRTDESNLTRAFAVHARTLEILDARGLADSMVATGRPVKQVRLLGDHAVDLSKLPSRFPFVLITPQYNTEKLLKDRAAELGVKIETGTQVSGIRQREDGVEVELHDGGVRHADYVVGTDGVRSAVRQAIDLPFPGKLAVGSLMLADVRFTEPPADVLTINATADGFAFIVPFGDGYWRVICRRAGDTKPDDVPADLEELRLVLQQVFGTDFGMHDPRWMSRFHSDERQAPSYRVGRVFLAGDAAHVHSPAGGQGMNTGLQDAANLGWKLAAEVAGWAPAGLLDSYEAERHPVGKQVLRGSGALLRMALLRNTALRAVRNTALSVALGNEQISQRVAATVSGVGIRYRSPKTASKEVGARMPDLPLAAGNGWAVRLYEQLRNGRFVLVTTESEPKLPAELVGRVDVVAPESDSAKATLVRPDGYIAWTGPVGEVPSWGYWTAAAHN